MVLGNHALQRGYQPDRPHRVVRDRLRRRLPVGDADERHRHESARRRRLLATKPYASGGAYINKMSDHCGDCAYDPKKRLGDDACPFTAGYWNFVHRNREMLAKQQPHAARGAPTWTGSRTSTPCSSRKRIATTF